MAGTLRGRAASSWVLWSRPGDIQSLGERRDLDGGEPGFPQKPGDVAVRVAALEEPPPRPLHELLHARDQASLRRRDVLDASEAATGSEHAPDLRERARRISHGAEHEARDHRVDAPVRHRQALRDRGADVHRDAVPSGRRPQARVRVDVGLDRDHVRSRLEVAKVGAVPGPDLEDRAAHGLPVQSGRRSRRSRSGDRRAEPGGCPLKERHELTLEGRATAEQERVVLAGELDEARARDRGGEARAIA